MLDQEELKWLAGNATALHRLLQQAAQQVEQVRLSSGPDPHLQILSDRIELASRSSKAIFDRISGWMLASRQFQPAVESRRGMAGAAAPVVSVPMPVGEIVMADESTSAPLILNPKGERELILLVDDDENLIETTAEILDFEDYRVIPASNGIEALQIYRRFGREIDLVLLDYFLPVMDGDAVFDELQAINPEVRVVLSSGFAEQVKVGGMLARGLCGFIPKPYTHAKLMEQLRSVLDA